MDTSLGEAVASGRGLLKVGQGLAAASPHETRQDARSGISSDVGHNTTVCAKEALQVPPGRFPRGVVCWPLVGGAVG